MTATARIEFPSAVQFLFEPARYKVPYGGRGSAKSWSVARVLLTFASTVPLRILCTREYQVSILDSVHRLLCDQIADLGLSAHFKITQNSITGINGSQFIFKGLHNNTTEIKSLEGVNIVWVEEAEKVSKASWDTLVPTIRTPWWHPYREELVGSEIWATFNPSEETDETYKRFVLNTPDDAVVRLINWRDNKWFPEELRKEKDYLQRVDYDDYLHIWEGQCTKKAAAQVLRGKWRVEAFEPESNWEGPFDGADWGFSVDPTVKTRSWVYKNRLFISHEAYGIGVETDDIPTLFNQIPNSANYVCRADSARPETISYVRRHGFPRLEGVDKWAGSVEDGINYLRQFEEIIIHPRCTHTAEEARLWSYKVDKNSGEVLPVLEDKHNHCWDSIRYGIAPLIKNEVKFPQAWWRYITDFTLVERFTTLRMITVSLDDVNESAAEFRATLQRWSVIGYPAMVLTEEISTLGSLPELIEAITKFYGQGKTSELWIDSKSVGASLIKMLRQHKVSAREWNPEDKTVQDHSYRAKQAAIHISAGRVFVPRGAAVISEISGLSTNAMSLALLIWQQRGGGKGQIPEGLTVPERMAA